MRGLGEQMRPGGVIGMPMGEKHRGNGFGAEVATGELRQNGLAAACRFPASRRG